MLAVLALGVAGHPLHLRTLMSPLTDFFLESQNTCEVNDPSPGDTSCCHFLSVCILHHFHIRAFPMSLSVEKMTNWQLNTILKIFFFTQSNFLFWRREQPLCAGSAHLGRAPYASGRLARYVCSPGYRFPDIPQALALDATHSRGLGSGLAHKPAGPWASLLITPRLIYSRPPSMPQALL